jgi:hypothetical protein
MSAAPAFRLLSSRQVGEFAEFALCFATKLARTARTYDDGHLAHLALIALQIGDSLTDRERDIYAEEAEALAGEVER